VVVLAAIRLALPYIVLHFANQKLATMKGYRGHVEDIDIALIRGAYKLNDMYLNKYDSAKDKQTPFFSARDIDLSVEWKALLHGSIVGELIFDDPMLRFTKDKVEPKQIAKDSTDFRSLLKGFMPLDVNRFEINNGKIQYIDEFSKPKVDIEMNHTHILAQNLKNSYDSTVLLPAKVNANADLYDGTLDFNMKLNPLAENATFDMNMELKNTNLVKLNDFFKAYAKADVNKGTFGLYSEVAAKEGKFTGYVKPLIKDLDILGPEDNKDNFLQKIWEGLVGTTGQVFKNQRKDQVGTKIPFEGDLKNPKANTWTALINVLENAFISALPSSIDNDINIGSVSAKPKEEKKTFLQKIFGKKDKDKDDKKDKK